MDEKFLREFFKRDRLARLLGIEIVEIGEGRARVCVEVQQEHLNGVDLVHGGTIFTLADFAFAIASNSHGKVAVGIAASISYVSPARGGRLFAEAREVACNPRLATYEVEVKDENGKTIAFFQGTAYRKKEPLSL